MECSDTLPRRSHRDDLFSKNYKKFFTYHLLTPHHTNVNDRDIKDKQYKHETENSVIDKRRFRTYRAGERGMHPVYVNVKVRNIVDVDVNVKCADVYHIVVVVDVVV